MAASYRGGNVAFLSGDDFTTSALNGGRVSGAASGDSGAPSMRVSAMAASYRGGDVAFLSGDYSVSPRDDLGGAAWDDRVGDASPLGGSGAKRRCRPISRSTRRAP